MNLIVATSAKSLFAANSNNARTSAFAAFGIEEVVFCDARCANCDGCAPTECPPTNPTETIN